MNNCKDEGNKEKGSLSMNQKIEMQNLFGFSNITKTLSGCEIQRTSSDLSRINYLQHHDSSASGESIKLWNNVFVEKKIASQAFSSSQANTGEDILEERFPVNVTNLMNEDQLWGCFYTFPELYSDVYSPVVRIRKPEDVPEIAEGVLSRDLVVACLSYLKRTPILGDFVFIKLNLSSKQLKNIDVLRQFKYLVYLDLSSNLLTELFVLSYLPYLQFLSVAFNRLNTVLGYEIPQWFLTEVHYKYNSVAQIRDLSDFWSITVLDLSHNNIKRISGIENLRYLRRLDLSFNHIQRLENLNHLRLLWLDVSYNNISSFEFNECAGLWSLFDLEYLNLNENNLVCMKIFSGCTRLRELHVRNNRLGVLLELAVYLRQTRRLIVLDLRSNPVCSTPGYENVVFHTFPLLLNLDAKSLDPVEQRNSKMEMIMDITTFASRRLLRLLYIEQLAKACVSPFTSPADTTEVPLVVLVGYEAVGKGYGEAYITDGKVRVATMDLVGALMLKLRGRRPYLILASSSNKSAVSRRQHERKEARNYVNEIKLSMMLPQEISTLQVLLSGRIIINGILNEILLALPEPKEHNEFLLASECSLTLEGEARHEVIKGANKFGQLTLSSSSYRGHDSNALVKSSEAGGTSLYSLYKESQGTGEYVSEANGQISFQIHNAKRPEFQQTQNRNKKLSNANKSVDFTKYTSSTWKGIAAAHGSAKSSKSVTFTSQPNGDLDIQSADASGLLVEPPIIDAENLKSGRSISMKLCSNLYPGVDAHDSDIWLAFLIDAGLLQASEIVMESSDSTIPRDIKIDDLEFIIQEIEHHQVPSESTSTTIRDDYEDIHRKIPGLFWDTIIMDDPNVAFKKIKKIIQDIVNTQKNQKPMFDIDFVNINYYSTVQNRLSKVCKQIAPKKLFL